MGAQGKVSEAEDVIAKLCLLPTSAPVRAPAPAPALPMSLPLPTTPDLCQPNVSHMWCLCQDSHEPRTDRRHTPAMRR